MREQKDGNDFAALQELVNGEWGMIEQDCYGCGGRGATGGGTEKACCTGHQRIGLAMCSSCNGTGRIMVPHPIQPRSDRDSESEQP